MQTVEKIAQEIVHREGGYVNDPDDPGGAPILASPFTPCAALVWIWIATGMWMHLTCAR
jgi:hypothetical protein